MIKKFASINSHVKSVKKVFFEIESWTEWMPGLKQLKILERKGEAALVEITQAHMGKQITQKLELHLSENSLKQRQISGWFRKWEGEWKFLQTPDGIGTAVSVSMEIDAGMFVPKFLIFDAFTDIFNKLIKKAEERAKFLVRNQQSSVTQSTILQLPEEKILQIYQTPGGLEIWIGDRRYFLKAAN
jgi:ribosome-associated toxin RatA of RatAB toxin-antitoxin module